MATHRFPILGGVLPLDANAYLAPYTAANSGSTQNVFAWRMSGTAVSMLAGVFRLPANYVGTPALKVLWTSQTTSGNVVFNLRHRTMTPGTDLMDISTSPTERADTVTTSSKPSAADAVEESSISLTTTDLVAGELVYFEFEREATHASDTKTDWVEVLDVSMQYADA